MPIVVFKLYSYLLKGFEKCALIYSLAYLMFNKDVLVHGYTYSIPFSLFRVEVSSSREVSTDRE